MLVDAIGCGTIFVPFALFFAGKEGLCGDKLIFRCYSQAHPSVFPHRHLDCKPSQRHLYV